MTRHEQDQVHEPSGIAFEFAGHLTWGNPRMSTGLAGDVEAWRCGRCNGLIVGEIDPHAEQHALVDRIEGELVALHKRFDAISPGAFKPIETPGKVEKERRNPSATALELGADVARQTRVARWRETAAVRSVPSRRIDIAESQQLVRQVNDGIERELVPPLDVAPGDAVHCAPGEVVLVRGGDIVAAYRSEGDGPLVAVPNGR